MAMNILFHKRFNKRFAKLSRKVQQKAVERIELFRHDSSARILDNHALVGKWTGYRSIDITGDYRAIFLMSGENPARFYTIDRHGNLYGK